ncbi:MAG: hypothetical protein K6T88_04860 [Bacillus sp. (in: Bacteria)]|nr:hypothetical protein [Bacillus sp. (in: firmicutes)]
MNENNNENHDDSPENLVDKNAIMNLANNLMKNEKTIDMGSIMRMATNLLTDDSLMNATKELGKFKQSPSPQPTTAIEDHSDIESSILNDLLKKLAIDVAKISKELATIKEQNTNLLEQISILGKDYKIKKKKK